ncbi:hypothetical protein NXS19_003636 [Fusarium pseudograminearum]|nr:hypothetical protein NXS19_003636 [Fusarium pseudograminearum]
MGSRETRNSPILSGTRLRLAQSRKFAVPLPKRSSTCIIHPCLASPLPPPTTNLLGTYVTPQPVTTHSANLSVPLPINGHDHCARFFSLNNLVKGFFFFLPIPFFSISYNHTYRERYQLSLLSFVRDACIAGLSCLGPFFLAV